MGLHLTALVSSDTSELTIASGEITITGMHHTIAAESGVTDTLSTIYIEATLLAALNGRPFFVILHAAVGDTITIDDGTAANSIYNFWGGDMTMTENEGVLLLYNPVGTAGWTAFGSPDGGGLVTLAGSQTLTNKIIQSPSITSPAINERIVTKASGTISELYGTVLLTGASPITYTLTDPSGSANDGRVLTIQSTTAQAHKIDNSGGAGFNGGGALFDFANFTGTQAGDSIELFAYNSIWYVRALNNVVIAAT